MRSRIGVSHMPLWFGGVRMLLHAPGLSPLSRVTHLCIKKPSHPKHLSTTTLIMPHRGNLHSICLSLPPFHNSTCRPAAGELPAFGGYHLGQGDKELDTLMISRIKIRFTADLGTGKVRTMVFRGQNTGVAHEMLSLASCSFTPCPQL